MVDVNEFDKALEFEVEKKLEKPLADMIHLMVSYTFKYIMAEWPTHTGWSAANHRINLNGRPITKVEPDERPSYKGALIDEVAINYAEQLNKLERLRTPLKRDITVVIGNAVPYAPDVGFIPGNGEAIYQAAADLAESNTTFTVDIIL